MHHRSVPRRSPQMFPRIYCLLLLQSVRCVKPSCGSATRRTPTLATKARRRDLRGGDADTMADLEDIRHTQEDEQEESPNLDEDGELLHCSQPRSKERPRLRFRIVSPLHACRHHLARRRLEASSSRHWTSQTEMQMRPSRGKTRSPPQLPVFRWCARPSCGRPSHQVCRGKKTSTASSWYETLQNLCLLHTHRFTPDSTANVQRMPD